MANSEVLYTELRDRIKTGDILVWEGSSLYSRIIRLWTGSPYTHVGLAWVVGGRVLVLQADPGKGVDVVPLSKNLPVNIFCMPKPLDEHALEVALDTLEDRYSMGNAIRAAFGLKPHRDGYQCVQFVVAVHHANGLHLEPKMLTPDDLVAFLEGMGLKSEKVYA